MDHRNKIYFFPAVLPLAAALPWLLSAFGAFAGLIIGLFSGRGRRVRVAALGLCAAMLAALCVLLWPRLYWRAHDGGSRLTEPPITRAEGPLPERVALSSTSFRGAWKKPPVWEAELPRKSVSAPVVVGSLIVLGSWDGTLAAYSLLNGAKVWSLTKREAVVSLLAASPNLLFAGEGVHTSVSSSLTAVELPRGSALWQREFAGHIEAPPAYSDAQNRVWVGTGPGGLWCLDAKTGRVLWHREVGHVDSTPLLRGNDIYLSAQPDESKNESVFLALRQSDGREEWRVSLPGQPWGSPIFDDGSGLILTTTGIGQIGEIRPTDRGWAHALSPLKRRLQWTTALAGNPIEKGQLLANERLVVFSVTNGRVIALQTATGAKAWESAFESALSFETVQSPPDHPAYLAALADSGELRLLDAKTGRTLHAEHFSSGGQAWFLPDGLLLSLSRSMKRYRWE